jgi:hypothetical protein
VSKATSALVKYTLFGGPSALTPTVSTTFRTGAANALERGALVNELTALHVTVARAAPFAGRFAPVTSPSVSEQIAALRRLLLGGEGTGTETGAWFRKAAEVSRAS